jgi:DNA-binding PadR family transcriptional regulator
MGRPGRPGRQGGPGRRGGRRRGDIRRFLLAGLLDGPAHGYELMRRLEERSDGRWRPSPGSVYPMLQQLEDEGLVRSIEGEGRRAYELTDEGRAQADDTALDELASDADATPASGLREEMEQLHLAVRQVRAVGGDDQITEVAGVLRQARQTIYRLLAEG